ncbi:unnamed protein product [Brassica oleracea]
MAQKVEAQGGLGGDVWDDGVYDGVRKVHVGQGQDGVSFINAVYEKANGDKVKIEGIANLRLFDRESTAMYMLEFTSNLLSVRKATVDLTSFVHCVLHLLILSCRSIYVNKIFGHESDVITSITFYIFKGKASPPYGLETEKKLALKEKNGGKLLGFHGRAGEVLHALGAVFRYNHNSFDSCQEATSSWW